jgi:hypothetical protein
MPILTATSEKVHGVVPSQFIYPQFIWMTPEQ